jgi:AraC-like DNA-binding protein
MVVRDTLMKLGISYASIELGEAEITGMVTDQQRETFRTELLKSGLELMDDKKRILIERIKNVVIEMVHYAEDPLTVNFSVYLAGKLNLDYTYMANLFSEIQGVTIEKFIIIHKIERVKELLVYDEMSLTEISHLMHYSSVAHLSTQFKKITGLTPTHFKQQKDKRQVTRKEI